MYVPFSNFSKNQLYCSDIEGFIEARRGKKGGKGIINIIVKYIV
jgi:hypothetical protein